MNIQTQENNDEVKRELKSLKRVIRWQGRFIAILILGLIGAIGYPYVDWQFVTDALNKRQPIEMAPPININELEYIVMAYQGTQPLKHGDATSQNRIVVVAHLYDYADVKQTFPNLTFDINGLNMDLDQTGAGQIELTLKEGDNIIESYYRYQSRDYQKRQIIIKYQP